MKNDRRRCKKSLHSFFEVAARIFRRPYRIAAARARATGGAGRGLSIVELVLQRHDTLLVPEVL
jgi:signal transduction histidine kinase